ncbi:glutamine amidotransferase of anthranilate synthase or aminodeoxychorismate synthase [Halobacteroides halobius DSM 5150]|uniref:Glutamine amidotransferase of anthranilate synthase or aminodeoxychorismate synthase n=1 Tax=Halobacteroides halobius (strain ATCC 35273 / DSM 5150 / MD-1) TaxID=748449 RepID=L0K776_HALHC|nr:aminodeoxychorismate/anthranilate synthase component II [Halobacteroides halobius]AGB40385.1 glutamine amidotransferase of anthranilate synthase or aminodeoxychorismate synthase [Halobacteroides halobius DSM 5150]
MVLVIDNYDSFTYNLVQLIGQLGCEIVVRRNDEITVNEIKDLNPSQIIISPGPGRPEDAGVSLKVVKEFSGQIPILGICLGHQTIGAAFGAEIIQAPKLVHGKTTKVINYGLKDSILEGIDDFEATRYHSLIIDPATLSARFEVTAKTEDDLIMGIRDKKSKLYGLQFHPESIMTEAGQEILNNFVQIN